MEFSSLDGLTVDEVFGDRFGAGLSFDDFIILPGYIYFTADNVKLATSLFDMDLPIISSPMDTVTSGDMAVAMATNGGAGVVHGLMPANEQCIQIDKLKMAGKFAICAVSTRVEDFDRVCELIQAGADAILIDSAQGCSAYQINMIQHIKDLKSKVQVIGGNVVTQNQAFALIEHGADVLRVGMGCGSICTTQEVLACGRSQATAIYRVSQLAKTKNVKVIADGGIRSIGDMVKAFVLGADAVMCGSILSHASESAGWTGHEQGARIKKYRGMASLAAWKKGGMKRYQHMSVKEVEEEWATIVTQGVESDKLLYEDDAVKLETILAYYRKGIQQSLQDIGATSINNLQHRVMLGDLKIERRSHAAQIEGSAHINKRNI